MAEGIALRRQDMYRLRLRAQGLGAARGGNAPATVRAAGAIQAQDRLGELLGVGVRSRGIVAADIDHARLVDRSVARNWLHRGTLQLVPAEDLRWLLDLLGAEMDRKALKRRADLGISADDHDRALIFLKQHLAEAGPLTRPEIAEALRSAGLPWDGQAAPHLLRTASLLGVICFGPDRGGENSHVLIDDWLPRADAPPDPGAELARRYLAAYGPAAPSDFRWWSGLPAAAARRAMQSISAELTEVRIDGHSMWMLSDAAAAITETLATPDNALRVLGPFDPYLLGYAKRDLGVSDDLAKAVNAGGGMIRSCVLLDGRLVGTWNRKRRAHDLSVTVTAFEPLSDAAHRQLEAEFAEIGRFLETNISWSLTLADAKPA